MNNNNNVLFDFMKSFMNPEFAVNLSKNIPAMDFTSFTNMAKKNAEILNSTSQEVAENMQSMIKKGSEILQNQTADYFNVVRDIISAEDPNRAAAYQRDYIKSCTEKSVNNSKELIDMASNSTLEIFNYVNKNISENISRAFNNNDN